MYLNSVSNQQILLEMLKHTGPKILSFSCHLPAETQCKAQHILLLNKHTDMPDSNVFYWKWLFPSICLLLWNITSVLNSKCIVIKANCRYIQYFKQQNILHFVSAVQARTSLASCYFLKKKKQRKKKWHAKLKTPQWKKNLN